MKKKNVKATTLNSGIIRRMKVILHHHKLASFPDVDAKSPNVQWSKLPELLSRHQVRLINCAPVRRAPPVGVFRGDMLPKHIATELWLAFGGYVFPGHIGPTDSSGDPIMDIEPWSDDERILRGNETDDIVIMVDKVGEVVARVRDIPKLAEDFKSFSNLGCSKRYPIEAGDVDTVSSLQSCSPSSLPSSLSSFTSPAAAPGSLPISGS